VPRGALCRHALGRGARGPAVSLAGAKRVSGNVALRPCRRTPMPRARSTGPCTLAMARSFAPPSRQRVRPAEPLLKPAAAVQGVAAPQCLCARQTTSP
jgi:hypothetical protein